MCSLVHQREDFSESPFSLANERTTEQEHLSSLSAARRACVLMASYCFGPGHTAVLDRMLSDSLHMERVASRKDALRPSAVTFGTSKQASGSLPGGKVMRVPTSGLRSVGEGQPLRERGTLRGISQAYSWMRCAARRRWVTRASCWPR